MSRFIMSVLVLAAVGCHSAPPRAEPFPPFYQNWAEVPAEITVDLENARNDATADPEEIEGLLRLAHATVRLVHHQSELWFNAPKSTVMSEADERRHKSILRTRVTESSRQALSAYDHCVFLGADLSWEDQLERCWLLILIGRDDEALVAVDRLLENPRLPSSTRPRVEDIRAQVAQIPSDQ